MNEQRAIDANALIAQLEGKNVFTVNTSTEMETSRAYAYGEVIGLIRYAPTIEPKRGEWKINSNGYYPYCSACGKEPKSGDMTDFCPSCGADMRKE